MLLNSVTAGGQLNLNTFSFEYWISAGGECISAPYQADLTILLIYFIVWATPRAVEVFDVEPMSHQVAV